MRECVSEAATPSLSLSFSLWPSLHQLLSLPLSNAELIGADAVVTEADGEIAAQ